MTIRRSFLNWGVFLICLGAVPLAVQLGVLDADVASDLLRLWPLILIGIGLGLLARLTPYAAIGGIVVAATVGLLLGVVIVGGVTRGGAVACAGNGSNANLETRTAPFAGNPGELDLELSCVDLNVTGGEASEWIVRADFSGDRFRLEQQPERLRLRDGSRGFFDDGGRRTVEISLPTSPVDGIATSITLNASRGTFNPGDAALNGVGITLNASDMRIDTSGVDLLAGLGMTLNASSATLLMPAAGSDSGVGITLNASSLTVCVAPQLDLDINASETLSSNNFADAGLVKLGDRRWHVDGSGAGQLSLSYTGNVSSITIDRSGGCQ